MITTQEEKSMKNKMYDKKKMKSLILSLILIFMVTGCGNKAYNTDYMMSEDAQSDYGYIDDSSYEDTYNYEEVETEGFDDSKTSVAEDVTKNRKLIKQTNLSLETLEYDFFIHSFETLIDETGGYIEYSDQSNRSYYVNENDGRYASYIIRIPEKKLEIFVNQIGNMANVRTKSQQVTDVTLSYVDLQSKRDMYEIEQKNLLELLERADTIEDMIIIESRLTEIRYQLQSMESQLRTYDNLVDYATITVDVNEVVRLEPNVEASPGERIRIGFKNSWNEVVDNIREFAINVIINSPRILVTIFVLALFVLVVLVIIKLSIKKSEKNRIKRMNEINNQLSKETREEINGK